jgi:integrase
MHRCYTHEEIKKILNFSEQRIRTVFSILASTGIRAGGVRSIRVGDLERINDIYKVTVYVRDNEEYFNFCTPETAKVIDNYLDFRKRHGERINQNSYLIVKKFDLHLMSQRITGKQFSPSGIEGMLGDCINNWV